MEPTNTVFNEDILCAHRSDVVLNPKRLVICCDGTWNNSNDGKSPSTNVSRLASAVAHKCCSGMPQVVYYHPGAGTEASWLARQLGGLLGQGVAQDVAETYRFVCDNYNPGDEIVLVGFSRGAFTARSVADMICNLGFLNRAGLDNLAGIFHDYCTWEDWIGCKKLDEKKHLLGFSFDSYDPTHMPEESGKDQKDAVDKNTKNTKNSTAVASTAPANGGIAMRPGRGSFKDSLLTAKDAASAEAHAEQIEADLARKFAGRKQSLWEKIKEAKNRSAIAKLYFQELSQQRLVLASGVKQNDGKYKFEPVPGSVKAVGVWDTVGSLGVPKGPLRRDGGRSADEMRFASLEMHRNVEFAFHALALDEYRSAFSPTLWQLPEDVPLQPGEKEKRKTVLRQVWFAGNHGDVGGGWADEQSANVALAWMADQLTSIGVEFSRPEFQRVFYDLASSSVPQSWAMGPIHNPPIKTAALDVAGSKVTKLGGDPDPRTPGLYCCDAPKEGWTEWAKRMAMWKKRDQQPFLARSEELVHPSVRIRLQCGGQGPDGAPEYKCPALLDSGYKLVEVGKPTPRTLSDANDAEWLANRRHRTVGATAVAYRNEAESARLAKLATDAHRVRVQQPVEKRHVLALDEPVRGWVWRHKTEMRGDAPLELPEEQIGVWERLLMKTQEGLVDWAPLYEARKKRLEDDEAKKRWVVTSAAYGAASTVAGWFSGGKAGAPKGALKWGYHDITVWLWGELKK
ncbi:hypothetical protein RB595_010571 [Gaeumannomyces hyphopodioides]